MKVFQTWKGKRFVTLSKPIKISKKWLTAVRWPISAEKESKESFKLTPIKIVKVNSYLIVLELFMLSSFQINKVRLTRLFDVNSNVIG